MAQKFSFRPGISITRSLGAPIFIQSSLRFPIAFEFLALGDFGAAEDGEVELVERDGEPLGRGDEFPGEGDGVLLEIIAEGKVAEHFEKGVMAVGEADVFEIVVLAAGADAFLAGGGALVVALLEAEEDILELVHPGVGEEQRGIVRRDERGAAHDAVAALFEEFQKCFADFVAGQILFLFIVLAHVRLDVPVWRNERIPVAALARDDNKRQRRKPRPTLKDEGWGTRKC